MNNYQIISAASLKQLQQQQTGVQIVDIRDAASYEKGHIPGAIRLGNDNLAEFITQADMEKPLVVVCYHGISSQSTAEYLHQQGFDEVYSLEGGFAAWPWYD